MAEHPANANVLGLTAQIVSAHVSNNSVSPDALPSLIQEVYKTLAGVGREPLEPERPQPAVPVKKSVFADHIICLEDGKKLKMLKRHLKTAYNMTPEQYREQMGSAAGLSDGGTELRAAPLIAGEKDRPRHQATHRAQIAAPGIGRLARRRPPGNLRPVRRRWSVGTDRRVGVGPLTAWGPQGTGWNRASSAFASNEA